MSSTTALVLVVLILVAFSATALTVVSLALIRGMVEMRRSSAHSRPPSHHTSPGEGPLLGEHPMFDRTGR